MTTPIRLYRNPKSGHCHRVELMLAFLGLPYETIDLDMANGAHKAPAYLRLSPFGLVPAIDDGGYTLSDSNAILVYLVQTYAKGAHWLPEDARDAAEVQRWLTVAADNVYSGPCAARLVKVFGTSHDHAAAVAKAHDLFKVLDAHLANREWLATDRITIADVACYSYIAHAPEGGVDLAPYPNVRAWLKRIASQPGFVPMATSPIPELACGSSCVGTANTGAFLKEREMTSIDVHNPFHEGERAAQALAGVGDMAARVGGLIRDYLPEQHRAFHSSLPFLVVSGADAEGRTWVTLVEGAEGFVASPDPRRITLDTVLAADDPLAATFERGTDIGVLGIELASRRRNRFSGHARPSGSGYTIDIRQTFGNCPQYIHERAVTRVDRSPGVAKRSDSLTRDQIARIASADTLFIGSGHPEASGNARGYDTSHRGGVPGFVRVDGPNRLLIPDYAGNNFFNTIGNLVADPRVGLLFVDFDTGGLLHVTGRARIDWSPDAAADPDARRVIEVDVEAVIERPGAVSLRWSRMDHHSRRLRIATKVRESGDITSFYLVPDDDRPLEMFKAGQHLPIEVQIPGQRGTTRRTYSLSGPPQDRRFYRISVKREDKGIVSRFLHDDTHEGSILWAQAPSGDFVAPGQDCPLVLASAGVGLTPMLSALWANVGQNRTVWYVHSTRNGATHALRDEVERLVQANPKLRKLVTYSQPRATDRPGVDYDRTGRITAADLLALGAGTQAHYMLCGPVTFQSSLQRGLEHLGVPASQIHQETFGPEGQTSTTGSG